MNKMSNLERNVIDSEVTALLHSLIVAATGKRDEIETFPKDSGDRRPEVYVFSADNDIPSLLDKQKIPYGLKDNKLYLFAQDLIFSENHHALQGITKIIKEEGGVAPAISFDALPDSDIYADYLRGEKPKGDAGIALKFDKIFGGRWTTTKAESPEEGQRELVRMHHSTTPYRGYATRSEATLSATLRDAEADALVDFLNSPDVQQQVKAHKAAIEISSESWKNLRGQKQVNVTMQCPAHCMDALARCPNPPKIGAFEALSVD